MPIKSAKNCQPEEPSAAYVLLQLDSGLRPASFPRATLDREQLGA